MKKMLLSIILAFFLASALSAEIVYVESQTFALGTVSAVKTSSLAPMAEASLTISPNPATANAGIQWALGSSVVNARLAIYNVRGEIIRTFDVRSAAGQVVWNARNSRGAAVPSGIYMARLTSGKLTLNKRLVLCR